MFYGGEVEILREGGGSCEGEERGRESASMQQTLRYSMSATDLHLTAMVESKHFGYLRSG
jgi:hypothetical protein